jgi:hypothetical protein
MILTRRDYEWVRAYIYAAPYARYCGARITTTHGRRTPAYRRRAALPEDIVLHRAVQGELAWL